MEAATLNHPITLTAEKVEQRVTALLARLRNNQDFYLDNIKDGRYPAREIAQLARLKRNKARDRVLLTLINRWFMERYGELPE